ncbi:CCA tRNA nucleotidyltransferase [Granulicella cerasi]|uniref:CCA tRNA nucleotidyltransferase n=1 Tax=Granulicella cerasi TaxID=741063 RepID=A0ABW1Z7M2_9BACT|nr:CCA tRNA nucleotidyltransferase [Granulicella cerasi]
MADYIYLLANRLTPAQFAALNVVREVARERGNTVFLVGGSVRDLTAGFSIRDLNFAVQGNALKLKKDFQKAGFTLTGEHEPLQTLFFSAPGGVRLEVGSTLTASYPKPGKPVYRAASILDDLRRRDFTANAMAISLNEGSYGLLMDPLNGVADIENMELRLVSNYGFIEDPARMIRAARLGARLGWQMEDRTRQRYDNGKDENYIAALSNWQRGYELEAIVHEEDPIRVLGRLESEGWMKFLLPSWTTAKANENELNKLRDVQGQLQTAGIHPDPSAAYFPLLTAKLAPKDVAELKSLFPRPGFVEQIENLDAATKAFATEFSGKAASVPSDAWRMIYAAVPEQLLWLAYTSKSAPVQARFKAFFQDWPAAKARIPYAIMQEMRITPDLPVYAELIDKLGFALMDGLLETPEALKAFLEPYSPPAPPVVNLRRRPLKRETKASKKKAAKAVVAVDDEGEEDSAAAPALAAEAAPVAPVEEAAPKKAKPAKAEPVAAPKPAAPAKTVAKKVVAPPAKAAKKAAPAPVKTAKKAVPVKAAKPVAKKAAPAKVVAKKAAKPVAKKVVAKKAVVVKKAAAKKVVAKKVVAKKAAPAKKPVAKKAVKKVAKKR